MSLFSFLFSFNNSRLDRYTSQQSFLLISSTIHSTLLLVRPSINNMSDMITSSTFTLICQSSMIFLLLFVISLIPSQYLSFSHLLLLLLFSHSFDVRSHSILFVRFIVSQVLVGWHHLNACPINPSIPQYLIVAGLVAFTLIVLTSLAQCMTRTCPRAMVDDIIDQNQSTRSTMIVSCGVCSIMCINLSLVIFLFGWFITGWIWLGDVWHRVQYDRKNEKDYCHPIVYQCTFVSLVMTTLVEMMIFCWICCKLCVHMRRTPKKEVMGDEVS